METLNYNNQLFVRHLVYSDNNIEIYIKRYINDQKEEEEEQQQQQQQQVSNISLEELISSDQQQEQFNSSSEEGHVYGEVETLQEEEKLMEYKDHGEYEQLINGNDQQDIHEEVPNLEELAHDGSAFADFYFQQINIEREIEQLQFNQLLEQFCKLSVSEELEIESEPSVSSTSEPSSLEEEHHVAEENELHSDISSISSFEQSELFENELMEQENEILEQTTIEEELEASDYESVFVYESNFVYESEFEASDQHSNEDGMEQEVNEFNQFEMESVVSEGSDLLDLFASFEILDISGSEEMNTTSVSSASSTSSSSAPLYQVYSEHPMIESIFGREYRFEYELLSFLDEKENEVVPPINQMYQYEWPLSFESESNDDNFNLPSQHEEEMVQELELSDSYSDCTTTESQSSVKDLYSVSYRF